MCLSHFPDESRIMKSLLINGSHVNHFNYLLTNVLVEKTKDTMENLLKVKKCLEKTFALRKSVITPNIHTQIHTHTQSPVIEG